MTTQNTAVFTFELINSPLCRPSTSQRWFELKAQNIYMKDVELPAFDSSTFALEARPSHSPASKQRQTRCGLSPEAANCWATPNARTHTISLPATMTGQCLRRQRATLCSWKRVLTLTALTCPTCCKLSPGCQFRTARSPVKAARQIASESRDAFSPLQPDPLPTVAQKGAGFSGTVRCSVPPTKGSSEWSPSSKRTCYSRSLFDTSGGASTS